MNKDILCFLCGLLSILHSCGSNTNRSTEGIQVNPDKITPISVYDLFSKIEIIPLETNTNSLLSFHIGEPDKMILHNNKFYFLEKKQESIVVFDKNGNFEKKIDKKGNGPGEYSLLYDFNINRFSGDLELMSASGYVNLYDSSGNVFKNRISLPHHINAIHYFNHLSPDIYVFFCDSKDGEKMLFYSVTENKIIDETYDMPFWVFQTSIGHYKSPFYIINDSLCFAQVYNGSIYNVTTKNTLEPRYSWDFNGKNISIKNVATDAPTEEELLSYIDIIREVSWESPLQFLIYAENSDYFFTRFKYKNKPHHLVWDKKNRDYFLFETFKEGVQCTPMYITDKEMYSATIPALLHNIVTPELLNDENRKKLDQLQDDDNPVIVKYTFK